MHMIRRYRQSSVSGTLYAALCAAYLDSVSNPVSDRLVCLCEQAGRFTRVIHPLDSMTQSVDGTDFGRWVTISDT